jgi:hypothetical protein
MRYVWEEELMSNNGVPTVWRIQHHLKKVWDKDPLENRFDKPMLGQWKATVAYVTKIGDRKWDCQFVNHNESRTFRSLKAAKAYAVAIITLEN